MLVVFPADRVQATVSRVIRWRAISVLPVLLFFACASPQPDAPAPMPPKREDPFLLAPTDGYPLAGASGMMEQVDGAHARLLEGLDLAGVEAVGESLLAEDPGFHPASVLLAQVDYARGRDVAAVERLQPILGELPDYVAAQLLLGRAAERSGNLPAALDAFSQLADLDQPLATRQVEEIRPRALEIGLNRLREEVDRGHVERAEEHLAWLAGWDASGWETLEGGRLVAVATGDLEAELAAVRQLAETTGELAFRKRAATLEVEIGDVRSGLDQLAALHREAPDDPDLVEQLELAKFLWRLQLLPPEVQEISRRAELDRTDLATLLYWLVPEVRHSQVTNPPIAADILDHPQHNVILRVLNKGLMEMDETLHRFEPEEPATRAVVLRALVRLLTSAERPLSCLADAGALDLDRSWRTLCQQAARCQVIPESADCRPSATVAGAEVLELFRRTLDLLGSR